MNTQSLSEPVALFLFFFVVGWMIGRTLEIVRR